MGASRKINRDHAKKTQRPMMAKFGLNQEISDQLKSDLKRRGALSVDEPLTQDSRVLTRLHANSGTHPLCCLAEILAFRQNFFHYH